jgi:hypothetical protein
MVQGIVTFYQAFLIIRSRAHGYGLVPVPAAGLHHGLKHDCAAVSGGGVQGVVRPAGTNAAVEFKPQTIEFHGRLYALTAKRAERRFKAIRGCIEQESDLRFWRKKRSLGLVGCLPVFSEVGLLTDQVLLSRVFSWEAILPLSIDTFSCDSYIGDSSAERRVPMATVTITFSDTEQQQIEGIVIDKDQDEALQVVAKLLEKIKEHPGHACGPKVV